MLSVLPNDRERLAPVTLPREEPVAQFEANVAAALAVLFQPVDHLRLRRSCPQTVDLWRIDGEPVAREANKRRHAARVFSAFAAPRFLREHFAHRQIKLLRELEITLVV